MAEEQYAALPSMAVEKKRQGYIALDIEATGNDFLQDACFAVGWAYGSCETDVVTGKVVLDLMRPPHVSWQEYWDECSYEKRCYDEFWSKNLDALNDLQDPNKLTLYTSSKHMTLALNDALIVAEGKFEKLTLVVNTVAFDTVWLSNLLAKEGLPGIGYKRNGTFNGGGIEVDSYKRGVYRVEPSSKDKPWDNDPIFNEKKWPIHDHDPENDAHQILSVLFASMDANKRISCTCVELITNYGQ